MKRWQWLLGFVLVAAAIVFYSTSTRRTSPAQTDRQEWFNSPYKRTETPDGIIDEDTDSRKWIAYNDPYSSTAACLVRDSNNQMGDKLGAQWRDGEPQVYPDRSKSAGPSSYQIDEDFLSKLYQHMIPFVRDDPDVPRHAFFRFADRAAAYRNMARLRKGAKFEDLIPPPTPTGWKDVAYLLISSGKFEQAKKALRFAGDSIPYEERLYLEILIAQGLQEPTVDPARKLLKLFEDTPALARHFVSHSAHRPDLAFIPDAPFPPLHPVNLEMEEIIKKIRDAGEKFSDQRLMTPFAMPDTFHLISSHGGRGQGIYVLAKVAGHVKSGDVKIVQGSKEHFGILGNKEFALSMDRGMTTWFLTVNLPDILFPGMAYLHIGNWKKEIQVLPAPTPPKILYMESRRVVPSEWARLYVRDFSTKFSAGLHDDPLLTQVVIEQDTALVPAEFKMDTEHSGVDQVVWLHIPKTIRHGLAEAKIKVSGSESNRHPFLVVDYPLSTTPVNRTSYPTLSTIAPGETLPLTFETPVDDRIAVVYRPAFDEFDFWLPQTPQTQFRAVGTWVVPKQWESGEMRIYWAERRGIHWMFPDHTGENARVTEIPTAPNILSAAFHLSTNPSFTQFDHIQRHPTTIYVTPGDLTVWGSDIFDGNDYHVKLMYEASRVVPLTVRAGIDRWLRIRLSTREDPPHHVSVAKYVDGKAGEYTLLKVEKIREKNLFEAKTNEGRTALKWLEEVYNVISEKNARNPSPSDLLQWLKLDTFPVSPWGQRWTYVVTADHPSYTFLGFDLSGTLRFQFFWGGLNSGVVEYDLLSRGAYIGQITENVLWTPPTTSFGLGNLIVDAIRESAKADMGIVSSSEFRGNLPRGPVTYEMIQTLFPLDIPLMLIELKGTDLKDFFKDIAGVSNRIYLSGTHVRVGKTISPSNGSLEYQVRGFEEKPIEDGEFYTLALPETFLEQRKYPALSRAVKKTSLNTMIRPLVEKYIRHHYYIKPDFRPRLTIDS